MELGVLARGGMGEVKLGMRQAGEFRRLVAIKRLRPEYADDPRFHDMFLAEARLAGLVRHANVVSVLDVGVDEGGPYLVMDYVEALTLADVLKAGAVPLQVALRIVREVALALGAAHALRGADGELLGLVHRDVSPQNVLLGFDGVARLTDFGIAKAHGTAQTSTGVLKGKVGYMAPEQLRFLPPTPRTDLFALGVVLHELLTGSRLYHGGDTGTVARRILDEPSPDLYEAVPDAPSALIELHFELLAKDPDDRPASADEVATRLGAVLDELVAGEGSLELRSFVNDAFAEERDAARAKVEALVALAETPAPRRARRGWWVAAIALLALGGTAAGVWWSRDAAPEPTATVPPPPTSPIAAPPAAATVAEHGAPEEVNEPARPEPAARRRRRPRRRVGMRAPAAAAAMDGDFSALDLIRGE